MIKYILIISILIFLPFLHIQAKKKKVRSPNNKIVWASGIKYKIITEDSILKKYQKIQKPFYDIDTSNWDFTKRVYFSKKLNQFIPIENKEGGDIHKFRHSNGIWMHSTVSGTVRPRIKN